MSALKRRIVDRDEGRYWIAGGTCGAITWALIADNGHTIAGPLGIHSPRPQFVTDQPDNTCSFLEGACYVHAIYLAGARIGDAWEAAGRDDNVIWQALESWYNTRLAGGVS